MGVIAKTERLVDELRAEANGRTIRRGTIDCEKLVARVLEFSGMPHDETWDRIKGARTPATRTT
jgi:hypothetical protein